MRKHMTAKHIKRGQEIVQLPCVDLESSSHPPVHQRKTHSRPWLFSFLGILASSPVHLVMLEARKRFEEHFSTRKIAPWNETRNVGVIHVSIEACSYGWRRFDLTVLIFLEDSRAKNHPSKHTVLFPKTSVRNKNRAHITKHNSHLKVGILNIILKHWLNKSIAGKNETEKRNLLNYMHSYAKLFWIWMKLPQHDALSSHPKSWQATWRFFSSTKSRNQCDPIWSM